MPAARVVGVVKSTRRTTGSNQVRRDHLGGKRGDGHERQRRGQRASRPDPRSIRVGRADPLFVELAGGVVPSIDTVYRDLARRDEMENAQLELVMANTRYLARVVVDPRAVSRPWTALPIGPPPPPPHAPTLARFRTAGDAVLTPCKTDFRRGTKGAVSARTTSTPRNLLEGGRAPAVPPVSQTEPEPAAVTTCIRKQSRLLDAVLDE